MTPGVGPSPDYELRLYVAGGLPNSIQARENLQRLCDEHLSGSCRVEIVDFLENPERALQDGVLVTPTLMKLSPAPSATVVGTLSERAAVLHALGITPAGP